MPLALKARILEATRRRRNNEIIVKQGAGVRSERAAYFRSLVEFINVFTEDVMDSLPEMLKSTEPEYIVDNYAEMINRTIRALAQRYRDVGNQASAIASEMANGVNVRNRNMFHKAMERAVGVNIQGAISEPGVDAIVQSKIAENVGLIQSIPDEYFKKLVTIVNEGTTRGESAGGITKEILKLKKTTVNRAKLIARDQTQKTNSAITQARQQNLGIQEYRWRTVGDESVRHTHAAHNGKIFRWDKPPKDTGHPGEDINCRCVAEPVIKLDDL